MKNWKDISLQAFQQVELLNQRTDLEQLDRVLLTACAVYDVDPETLDRMGAKKALRMADRMTKVFEKPFTPQPCARIGPFELNYAVATYTFGQFIDLMFFGQAPTQHAHRFLATICFDQQTPHRTKADFFLSRRCTDVIGSVNKAAQHIVQYNAEFPSLFGLDDSTGGMSAQMHRFNQRYGWIYSATQVMQHEGITLEQTFQLPVRRALNALDFLKEKSKYEAELYKSQPHGR